MRCTVSFLGSPDDDKNPEGWRWQQAGMTALILALSQMVWWRHRNFTPSTQGRIKIATGLYGFGFALIMVSIWITDSEVVLWGGLDSSDVHTTAALIGIFTTLFAVSADWIILRRAGVPRKALWPFRIYGSIWAITIFCLISWEWKCQHNPKLHHFPGDGIHSTPMWEWILLLCLTAFMIWISQRRVSDLMPKPPSPN